MWKFNLSADFSELKTEHHKSGYLCMIHNFCFNPPVIFLYLKQQILLLISFVICQKGQALHKFPCTNMWSCHSERTSSVSKTPYPFITQRLHSSNTTEKVKYSFSNGNQFFLQLFPACCNTYFADQGPYDARPVALQQALLINRVMTNQVFHHKQEGSNAVSLQSALWKKK